VRAVFAFIDGFTSVLKSGVLSELSAGRCTVSPAELYVLLEKSYYVDKGVVKDKDSSATLAQNIRFGLEIAARTHGISQRPDYGDTRCESLQRAIGVRNRVTHPKTAADLEVSDEELADIDASWAWFFDASMIIYATSRTQTARRARDLRAKQDAVSTEIKSAEDR
jgi:hypothetical protein